MSVGCNSPSSQRQVKVLLERGQATDTFLNRFVKGIDVVAPDVLPNLDDRRTARSAFVSGFA